MGYPHMVQASDREFGIPFFVTFMPIVASQL